MMVHACGLQVKPIGGSSGLKRAVLSCSSATSRRFVRGQRYCDSHIMPRESIGRESWFEEVDHLEERPRKRRRTRDVVSGARNRPEAPQAATRGQFAAGKS